MERTRPLMGRVLLMMQNHITALRFYCYFDFTKS